MKKILIVAVLAIVYHRWFSLRPLSAGDWSFHFPEEIAHFFMLPSAWRVEFGGGLGGSGVFLTGLHTYFLATARLLPWIISERIFWYIPFLLVGTFSSIYLVKTVLPNLTLWWFTPIIFLTNTYILLITDGGQMGIAMAYAIAPLVLAQFIKLFEKQTVYRGILTGLLLSVMILFDPRIAYVLMIGVLVKPAFIFAIPFILSGFIHAFWILPLVAFRVNPMESMGVAYNSIAAVRFFSFADFSHALSLLHPNWPENLFGKIYFLQPEFLVIPVIAFAAILMIKDQRLKIKEQNSFINHHSSFIKYFAFLALVGVFLAKGANDPGGAIYLWLFAYVPGFNVFRDPTKFYLLIAIAYSILIPVALERIGKKKTVVGIIFILFWLFTIRQSVTGQLGGTFVSHTVPQEYEILKDVINKPEYFRTFWVPGVQRYGFSSYMHPAIDAATILNTSSPSAMLAWLDSDVGIQQLKRWSVKYVILPYDSQGEIFLDDRKYSESKRDVFKKALDEHLPMQNITPKISVYEMAEYKDHLWLEDVAARLAWKMTFPTSYTISISDLNNPTQLIFSESYDPYWQLTIAGRTIKSQKTPDSLNSFPIPALGSARGRIEYLPQRYVWIGLGISIVAMCCATIILWNQKKYR